MTDSYSLLNRDLRFYIHEKGWPSLTKIQNASIKAFYTTNNNLILSAPTASGKTEACFLPAISKVSTWDKGIKILYVSPLIALINDQFKRISDMCLDMDIPITSWHGEASQSKKEKIIENPRGIVLITPESIEAMLVNKSELAKTFFLDVEYIIVDEIHSFLFGNRGLQLKSLLERILRYTYNIPRMIGLSATIGEDNYDLAKEFFNNGLDTNILVDKSRNDLDFTIDYFNTEKVSLDVISKLREYALDGPMLIFPNSRDKVETIAVKLNQLFKEKGEDIKVFAHHSSVSKQKRSEIENFAKEAKKEKFAICATSTLELGIDIGAVASVSQYGSAHNALTLAQRLGRSGRISKTSILHQISTNPWELLESLATIKLYQDSILDPIEKTAKAYDVFAHQVLSSLLENFGMDIDEYKYLNKTLTSFSDITDEEFEKISEFLQKEGYIEIIENQVIAGTAIEKLMIKGNFYNQFVLSGIYNVYNDKGKIGELEIRPEVQVDSNIYLAGSIWRITQILYKNKKILVEKANAGKAPKFSGIGDMDVSKLVRNKMKEILKNPDKIFDNDEINEVIDNLKEEFSDDDYLFVAGKDQISLRTFQSSKVNRTLAIMLNIASNSKKFINDEVDSSIKGPDIIRYFDEIRIKKIEKKDIFKFFKENELFLQTYLNANKYMVLVPDDLKIDYIIRNRLDFEACYKYLAIEN
ncbi:DEAD/DEAH box helicase [Anaerococcus sp. Marseille-P3625]|uniref:DEAD/DEAH box helicase n=1 Tax=Anaerococcus sp. Marseille-P3625 TaxID=1977277 RepID=UPI000C07BD51|nr:DEAD/DEAH box helicase [Anaerococcus sp. Marseille-P3625]